MVKIVDLKESQNESGDFFYRLKVQGGAELVQSKDTGKYYLTARTAYINTTFDKSTCEKLIGSEMLGSVQKVDVEPYDFTVPDTGEVITLNYSWEYFPGESESPVTVKQSVQQAQAEEMGW